MPIQKLSPWIGLPSLLFAGVFLHLTVAHAAVTLNATSTASPAPGNFIFYIYPTALDNTSVYVHSWAVATSGSMLEIRYNDQVMTRLCGQQGAGGDSIFFQETYQALNIASTTGRINASTSAGAAQLTAFAYTGVESVSTSTCTQNTLNNNVSGTFAVANSEMFAIFDQPVGVEPTASTDTTDFGFSPDNQSEAFYFSGNTTTTGVKTISTTGGTRLMAQAVVVAPAGADVPSVAFTHPTQGTSTADYTDLFWTGTFDFATSTTHQGQVFVLYSQSSTLISQNNTTSSSLFTDESGIVTDAGAWSSNKIHVLWDNATSTWYAKAILWDYDHLPFASIVASTSIISFTVTEPQAPATFAVSCTATSTLPSACLSSGSFFGDIKQGVCVALACTFIPSPSQQATISSEFSGIKNSVSSKPPVGYFTLAYNALSDALSTTTTGFFSGSLSALNGLVTPLDLGAAGLLALLFLVWVIHRIRDFHL